MRSLISEGDFNLSRMNEDRKPRQFFEARPNGGRPRGRPRVTYEESIEEMGRKVSKSVAELKRMAQDQKKWKSFTKDPPTLISNQGQLKKKKETLGISHNHSVIHIRLDIYYYWFISYSSLKLQRSYGLHCI